MKRRRRQHGFALLLTLVLLMIAVVALAAVARRSTGEAVAALEATEALQRRWVVTSCRATLLPRANGLLAKAARERVDADGNARTTRRHAPPGTGLWVSCELAGVGYDLVLTDEQAKYNPTVMGGLAGVRERAVGVAVRELSRLDRAGGGRPGVRLRPMIGREADGSAAEPGGANDKLPPVYGGYGQLFEGVSPAALLGGTDRPGAASMITCWGDGRLNLRRAPDAVIRRVLGPVLGPEGVTGLLAARDEMPGVGAARWLASLTAVPPAERALAGAMLTEQSRSQGLWVVAHGRTRSWYTLAVRVYTPPLKHDEPVDADARVDVTTDETIDEEPDPVQRYDYAW